MCDKKVTVGVNVVLVPNLDKVNESSDMLCHP